MDSLPSEFRQALIESGYTRKLRAGETLMTTGDESTDVFLVSSGRLRVSLFSRGGREPILADLAPGHLVGELAAIDNQPRSATVSAITESEVVKIDADTFRTTLFREQEWVWWLLRGLSARSRNLTDRTFEFATLSVHGRVMSEIARLTDLTQSDGDTAHLQNFPTHEDLAARLGTQREAVTRSLRALTKSGVINQARRNLHILSIIQLRKRLEAEGGEWPRA